MSWLSLNGEPWVPLIPGSQELAGIRFKHLGPCGDPHIVTAGDLPVIHYPSDGGPPCRLRDLQLFRSWADQRRVGPQPGVEIVSTRAVQPPPRPGALCKLRSGGLAGVLARRTRHVRGRMPIGDFDRRRKHLGIQRVLSQRIHLKSNPSRTHSQSVHGC